MSEFEKGDLVRVKETGELFTVYHDDGWLVYGRNKANDLFGSNEVELAAPRPGKYEAKGVTFPAWVMGRGELIYGMGLTIIGTLMGMTKNGHLEIVEDWEPLNSEPDPYPTMQAQLDASNLVSFNDAIENHPNAVTEEDGTICLKGKVPSVEDLKQAAMLGVKS